MVYLELWLNLEHKIKNSYNSEVSTSLIQWEYQS